MKYKSLFVIVATSFLTLSCSSNTGGPNMPVEQGITYDDIYKKDISKKSELNGKEYYSASYGYDSSSEQGYNHFYYLSRNANHTTEMKYENDLWSHNESFIDKEIMCSSSNDKATRRFISPFSGKCLIKNSVYSIENSTGTIAVYLNNELIKQFDLMNESLYEEFELDLNESDKLDFVYDGTGKIRFNPIIDFAYKETGLHHACDGYFGDVHPFYNEKENKLYMYYLSTGNQKQDKKEQFSSLLQSSTNMFNFSDDKCEFKESNRHEQDLYYVLNVYEDRDGKYRSSVGGNFKACNSYSEDLHVWENGSKPYESEDGLLKWSHVPFAATGVKGMRDPDTFYDKDSDSYYTVVISYYSDKQANGEKHLTMYIADAEGHYSDEGYKVLDFTSRGDPECPQIMKIGDYWYLMYSVYGTGTQGNVGRFAYRRGDKNTLPQDVDWNSKEEQFINSPDLHAAQLANFGDKFYLYGWINQKFNLNIWGGYLNTPIEVYQDDNGNLLSKLDEKLISLLDKGLIFKNTGEITKDTVIGDVSRNYVALTLGNSSKIQLGNYEMGFSSNGIKRDFYLKNDDRKYFNSIPVDESNNYDLKIMIDGQFIELSINDKHTMSALTDLLPTSRLTLLPNGDSIQNLKISKLASLENIYL